MSAVPRNPSDVADPAPSRAWWGDLSVRTKVLAAVVLTALVGVTVGLLGLSALSTSSSGAQLMYDDNVKTIVAISTMRNSLTETRIATRNAILAQKPEDAQAALDSIPTLQEKFHAAEKDYRAGGLEGKESDLVDSASAAFDGNVRIVLEELTPLALAKDYATWSATNEAKAKPLGDQARDALNELFDAEVSDTGTAAAAQVDAYQSQRTQSIVILTVGILAALAVGVGIARGLARGVRRVQDVADALADGDLTRSSGLTTRDELGRMGRSLDSAVAGLRDVLSGVVTSADAVAASSEELSASSAQISASAEETSAQSGVVSSAAEEVSRNVQTVAAGAEQMGASIREIASNAAEASEVAARAVTAAETTTATVAKLGDSSAAEDTTPDCAEVSCADDEICAEDADNSSDDAATASADAAISETVMAIVAAALLSAVAISPSSSRP